MNYGDTFKIRQKGRVFDAHLWVIISDPVQDAEHVVIVNMTSFEKGKDDACCMDVGDHPFIKRKTCIEYAGSQVISAAFFDACVGNGTILPHTPATDGLLEKIHDGAAKSEHIKIGHLQILIDQGLVKV